ncbi:hypothetical protein EUTSA_v10009198mg [Eutrema salsugineum]|uniref:Uncharacterized protein n=1 Tax=Eutrema salsugineum TaxID=72664 RepID=V4L277_EUTSA|nr:hypothetical protein EUTSA_v10009198mg [Eutrema salsugineum]
MLTVCDENQVPVLLDVANSNYVETNWDGKTGNRFSRGMCLVSSIFLKIKRRRFAVRSFISLSALNWSLTCKHCSMIFVFSRTLYTRLLLSSTRF